MKLLISILIIFAIFIFPAFSEYSVDTHPNFSVSTHGTNDNQTFVLSGTYPLDFVDGYAGAEWIHFRNESPDNHDFIRARLEGGYHRGMFGLRMYGRYGKSSVSAQDSLLHGGAYLHIDVIDKPKFKANAGIGTWLSKEELHAEYNVDTDLEWGPQAHLELQISNISVLGEFLPNHTFDNYQVRVLPIWIIPIAKVLFVDKVALEISGEIRYDSITHHIDIDPWKWHWKNALNFQF